MTLSGTTATAVGAAVHRERLRMGSPAVGMVMTLLILTDELHQADALTAASEAAREHPMRVIALIERPGRTEARLDAQVHVGGDDGAGEIIALRLHGELAAHAGSVAIPLLLPDTPIVAWWPGQGPAAPATDAIGKHAQRRITDTGSSPEYLDVLQQRRQMYAPGDTDLTWTRTTPWRSMLAAALDQPVGSVTAARVVVEDGNPSGWLLAGWLQQRLGVPTTVARDTVQGVGSVTLTTTEGAVTVSRADGRVARLSLPGMPDATVALPRRGLAELLTEELRRLDPDEVYYEALAGIAHVREA